MIENEPVKPAPSVCAPGMPKQNKPANSAMPRQAVGPSMFDGPYGGKKPA